MKYQYLLFLWIKRLINVVILSNVVYFVEMATRWGIVGTSNISHDFVVAMNTLPRTEHLVLAVASTDINRSREFAKQFEIPKAYDSYLSVATDAEVGKNLS